MKKRPTVTAAQMRRMRREIESAGLPFLGFKHFPDGSVIALVGETMALTPANTDAPSVDDEFAAWAQQHGYG